jgi:hypothetical protein
VGTQRGGAPGWVANLSLGPDLIERTLEVSGERTKNSF